LIYTLKQPALFQHERIVDNYLNLCRTQTFLYRFDDALNSVNNSLNYVLNNLYVENFIKEEIALILIYKKEYWKAIELLKFIITNKSSTTNPVLSKRQYFLAVAEFLNGDYKASFFSLQDTAELEDDKDGWNIGVRMLQIILTLQTEKIDLADKKIENLRKHIERTIKMKSIRKRDIVIFRLLSHLSRSGFDFKEVWEDRQKDFKLLRSDDPDYYWVPRSHELILFDQWFESKVKNVPYDPKFPDPVE
jgi:tetratricopeptide (TPR) repeat protein